ncbi:MAG: FAD-binding oxidoreductase [Gemmatimonadaceae bacterium]
MSAAAAIPAPPPDVREAASAADVQAALRAAAEAGCTVRIAGAGGWLRAGRPVRASRTLSLRPLAGVVAYVPGDLTLTAEAGTSLHEIDAAAAEHGQWLALDPFGSRDGTLGATVATASAGPLAASFGTPRDVVLGLDCVTGDGELVNAGARVVKHVAGFDLVRLMTGAWGTLGVLTRITVRLRARPAADQTYALTLPHDWPGAWFAAYRAGGLAPLAAELVAAGTAAALGIGRTDVALLRLCGNDAAVTAQETVLRELGTVRAVEPAVWNALATLEPYAPAAALRLSHRPARIAEVWTSALALAAQDPDAIVHCTLDRGVARVVLPRIAEHDLAARLAAPSSVTRVAEVLPDSLWAAAAPNPVADEVSRAIRSAFDPARRLNPGIWGEA